MSSRVHYLDSAKFVLVLLVVAGHVLEQVRWFSPLTEAAYRFIYLFHIPALVFVSGMVASAGFDSRQGRRWLALLVLPYLVFQGIYLYADALWLGKDFSYRVIQPFWLLWYLMSLATWRLLLPVFLAFGKPLLIAAAVALLAGCIKDVSYPLSLSRTLVFMPFFVAGHLYGHRWARGGPQLLAVAVLVGLAVLAWSLRGLGPHWFYGSMPYNELKSGALNGMAIRAGLLLAGMAGTWAVLRLMPLHLGLLARLGAYSLGIYLIHGLPIRFALSRKWFNQFEGTDQWLLLLGSILAALLLAIGSTVLARWLRPLLGYEWLWRDRSRSSPAASPALPVRSGGS